MWNRRCRVPRVRGRGRTPSSRCCAGSSRSSVPPLRKHLPATLAIAVDDADAALLALESSGVVLRGRFSPAASNPCWCAGMVRPQPPRADSSLYAAQVTRRDRAGDPGRLHAVPLVLAASRALVEADRDRRLARDRGAARRLRAFRGGLGAGRAAGTAGRIRATDARHAVPRRGGGVVEAVPAAVGTAGDAAARTGDAHRTASSRARRCMASAAW